MEAVRLIALFLHIVGVSALLGGFLSQLLARSYRVTRLMVSGADLQILTGLILVVARAMQDMPSDHTKVAVKLLVALAVAVLAHIGRRKERVIRLYWTIGALTVANVVVAVFWQVG